MNNSQFYKNLNSSALPHYLDKFMDSTAANVYWKDKKGIYLGVNDVFACANDLKINDIIGAKDFDYAFGEEHALLLRKNDQEVIYKDQSKTALESVKVKGVIHYYLSHKAQLRSNTGKIIGIFGVSFSMNGKDAICTALNEMSTLVHVSELNRLESLFDPPHLTKRQFDCLFYLVKGKTMKQTAEILVLSPKTIEHYLDAVKVKFKCYTRSELIEKALQLPQIKEKL